MARIGNERIKELIIDRVYNRIGDRFTKQEITLVYTSLFRSLAFVQANNPNATAYITLGSFFSIRISEFKIKRKVHIAIKKYKAIKKRNKYEDYHNMMKASKFYEEVLDLTLRKINNLH